MLVPHQMILCPLIALHVVRPAVWSSGPNSLSLSILLPFAVFVSLFSLLFSIALCHHPISVISHGIV